MQVHINGDAREVPDNTSLSNLVTLLNLPNERLAIELNHAVIRRTEWPVTELHEGDKVEIVHFVGGGSSSR